MTNPFTDPRWRPVTFALIAFLGGTLVALVVWTVFAIRGTQIDNKTTLNSAARAAVAAERGTARIEDCTTAGHDCYDEQQARAGEFISGINEGTLRVIVAALSCQEDGVTEERALARCTARRASKGGP